MPRPIDSGACSAESREAVALCVVTNFTVLRRKSGQHEWSGLLDELASALSKGEDRARARRIAPDCIEVKLITDSNDALHAALSRIGANCESFLAEHASGKAHLAIGAAIGDAEIEPLTLLEQAEQAVSEACRGRRIVIVEADEHAAAFEDIALLRDLPTAATNGEFFLLYQPKVHVREQRACGAEALIRWLHPEHGLIMPDAFIETADASGDIVGIALWTLHRVIADQSILFARGHRQPIFINISGRLLTDTGFIDEACGLVQSSGAAIGFEITETSVIRDPDLAIFNLERCARVGIELAIDDYGSGLSSLAYLKRLPARELKIDKQFITQLTNSHRDPLIVRSTIDLAHALDMQVTAEGVESPAALALLTVMGCEMVQGYLISSPLKFEAYMNFLAQIKFDSLISDATPSVVRPASFWKRR